MSTAATHTSSASSSPSAASTVTRSFGSYFVWVGGGKVASEGLRLGSTLLLTRLLTQDMFGLVLVVNRIVRGLTMASDIGINASIIQNKAGSDADFLNTAWTVQIVRGALLWLVCCGLAPIVAAFYDHPQLMNLLPVAGLSLLLAGFNSPALALIQRTLRVRTWVLIDVAVQLTSVAAMIATATMTRSVWALIIGAIVAAAARMAVSHLIRSEQRPRLGWDRQAFRILLTFGVWIVINTFIGWLADSAEGLTLPRIVSMDVVGVYGVAFQLGNLPYKFLVAIGANAVFPLFSRMRNQGDPLLPAYLMVQKPLLVVGGAVISAVLALGGPAIELALDPRWHSAATMLLPILVGQWFRVLAIPGANAVFALGYPQWLVAGNTAKLLGYAAFVPVGVYVGQLMDSITIGALWGFACGESLSLFTYRWALAREGLHLGAGEIGPCVRVLLSILMVTTLQPMIQDAGPFLRGPACLAAIAPLWAGPLYATVGEYLRERHERAGR